MGKRGYIERNPGNRNGIGTGGVGYVVIPDNVKEVGSYVQQCYRSNEITISGDGYGIMSHVKVADGVMPRISFPNNERGTGSLVVWVRESFYNRPIVVAVLANNDTPTIQAAGQQTQRQTYGGISTEVLTDAVNAIIQIYACGNINKPSQVIIKAGGSDRDVVKIQSGNEIKALGKNLEVKVTETFDLVLNDGEQELIRVEGDKDVIHFIDYQGNEITINNKEDSDKDIKKSIEIKDTFGRIYTFDEEKAELTDQFEHRLVLNEDEAHYADKFNNEVILNEDNVQIKCAKYNLGDGAEPMVLGDTLKGLMEELIDAINAITVPTPYGPSGMPLNSVQFSAIKAKLGNMLSQLSNTD